jgi:DNA-directed RNA polymerase subunit RPC12/RpoP
MSYLIPQTYKCIKCGFEIKYSPHNHHSSPTTDDFISCPNCWEQFLREHIGELKCTVNFTGTSEYDESIKEK